MLFSFHRKMIYGKLFKMAIQFMPKYQWIWRYQKATKTRFAEPPQSRFTEPASCLIESPAMYI